MKKRSAGPELLFLTASLALAVVLAMAGSRLAKTQSPHEEAGSSPDFRLATLDGRELGPSDFRGQVVLLDFWATWCMPCRYQEEILVEMQAELEGLGVQILAVNLGEEASTIRDHYEHGLPTWPVLLDAEDRLTAALGIEALPSLMILHKSGTVSYFDVGILDAEALRVQVGLAGSS